MARIPCRFHPNGNHVERECFYRHDAGDPRKCGPTCEGPHGHVDGTGPAGDYVERGGVSW